MWISLEAKLRCISVLPCPHIAKSKHRGTGVRSVFLEIRVKLQKERYSSFRITTCWVVYWRKSTTIDLLPMNWDFLVSFLADCDRIGFMLRGDGVPGAPQASCHGAGRGDSMAIASMAEVLKRRSMHSICTAPTQAQRLKVSSEGVVCLAVSLQVTKNLLRSIRRFSVLTSAFYTFLCYWKEGISNSIYCSHVLLRCWPKLSSKSRRI